MKNCVAAFMLVAACLPATAAPLAKHRLPPHLTADEFVSQYRGQPGTPGWEVDQRYAQGYLAGVVDVSQGRVWWLDVAEGRSTWCVPRGADPAKADEQVVAGLAQLLPKLAKRPHGSLPAYAGPALLKQYAAKFPTAVDTCTITFKPHLTGDELLSHQLVAPGQTKWAQTGAETLKREYAAGYQAGVVDTTQGHAWTWCAPSRLKPAEVNDRVWTEMKKRSGSMPGNGAIVLLELYTARFPCNRR